MKKLLSLIAIVFTLGLGSVAMDAEAAKRMGSGKSMGTQRSAAPDKAPAAANQPSAGAPGAGGAAAAPARSSWMGPVAGLAAGLGLAALASHLGFGDELASMVMMGLLAVAVMAAIGFFMRKRAAAQQSASQSMGGLQPAYANLGNSRPSTQPPADAPAYKVSMPAGGRSAIGSGIGGSVAAMPVSGNAIPADFDVAGFERNAKVNFIRLQAANDAGNLDDIRQFTTPEMFAELKMDLADRGAAAQKSDVARIEAKVVGFDEDADRYLVSVRFIGEIADLNEAANEPFDEIWHMMKARQGNSGWVLSGIQQSA